MPELITICITAVLISATICNTIENIKNENKKKEGKK